MKQKAPLYHSCKAIIISALILGVPSHSLACGKCVDHSIDWIAPFILPMFPAIVIGPFRKYESDEEESDAESGADLTNAYLSLSPLQR